jgi:hypothetical protein
MVVFGADRTLAEATIRKHLRMPQLLGPVRVAHLWPCPWASSHQACRLLLLLRRRAGEASADHCASEP